MRGVNNTMDTINAAAIAIASADHRVPHVSVQKRRWGGWWRISWCFGSHKQNKRISHAALVPEPVSSGTEGSAVVNPIPIVLPFIAPPSSPASFLQSEASSVAHSPTGLLSFSSISANMYSPGPASIFAIGPYAHEPQLVSPPVFSTFTTEPSTAPLTPPPESVHLTTPSSPEVPFARLVGPAHQNGELGPMFPVSQNEFQSYQLYPGSPVGQLISPSSGTLTPDYAGPKSRDGFMLDRQNSSVGPLTNFTNGGRSDEITIMDHRVSFEITAEEILRCVERRRNADLASGSDDVVNGDRWRDGEDGGRRHKHRLSTTLGSIKEFNFDNTDGGGLDDPNIGPDWWASNEKVIGKDGPSKNWSFFAVMQPGVS